MPEIKQTQGLTRRRFLQTTATLAGSAALASTVGCSSIDTDAPVPSPEEVAESKTFINYCRGNCGGICQLESTIREGKIVRTAPQIVPADIKEAQSGCVKGHTTPQRIYATNRVLYPMKQTGERGSDNWERISWDEAISLIAEKFQAAFDEFGPASVALWHGAGSFGHLNGSYYTFTNNPRQAVGFGIAEDRFLQKTGITLFTGSSDFCAQFMAYIRLMIPMNTFEDVVNANSILLWGFNPTDAQRSAWVSICKARDNGAKLVCLDPQFSNAAAHADKWLPIRGGTDPACMLAMCNYIIEKDYIDYDYLANRSVAPLLIKDDGTYLRLSDLGMEPVEGPLDLTTGQLAVADTEVVYDSATQTFGSSFQIKDPAVLGSFDANGIHVRTVFDLVKEKIAPFTIEFAAQECDLPPEQIIELAEMYANDKPSTILTFMGIEHFANSSHIYKNLVLLGSLTGNMNKPGASVFQYGGTGGFVTTVLDKSDLVVPDRKESYGITGERLVQLMESGKWGDKDYPIRCVYVMNANPLSSGLGTGVLKEAFKQVDFTVVADSFMTDTAKYASLVLPICLSWEQEDFNGYFFMQKALEPMGESRSDIDIFRDLATKMGFPELYDKTDEEYLRTLLDTPENIAAGCAYDDFKEQGVIHDYKLNAVVGSDYNPTGRSQFYLEYVFGRDDYGQTFGPQENIPWYESAAEAYPGNPLMEKYPLFAMSYHDNFSAQSIYNNIPWLDELRGPFVQIYEDTAVARGIKQGDLVRVFNDRGHAVVPAILTKGIRPDTVLVSHGFQEENYISGHTQDLTLMVLDPVTSNNNLNDMLVEVEKYEGGAQ